MLQQEQQQMRMELSRNVVFIAKHFRIILHNGKKSDWEEEHSLDHSKNEQYKATEIFLNKSLACYYSIVKDNNSTKRSFFPLDIVLATLNARDIKLGSLNCLALGYYVTKYKAHKVKLGSFFIYSCYITRFLYI